MEYALREPQASNAMIISIYAAYTFVSVIITLWVGRSLHKNGRVFLVENFLGREEVADSVNHLLLVGFYLVNIGFVAMYLKYGIKPQNLQEGIEFLSTKIGTVILALGAMHFFNMYVLIKLRRFGCELGDKFLNVPQAEPAGR